nr:zinc finger CCCH domain-containing protein 49-like [Ipomoea batatas]
MAHRLLRDAEADGWERSDFPIICESCLGDSPYVRMSKADYDKECRFVLGPSLFSRWRPVGNCEIPRKLRSVRTPALVSNSNDASKSDVNRRNILAEEHDPGCYVVDFSSTLLELKFCCSAGKPLGIAFKESHWKRVNDPVGLEATQTRQVKMLLWSPETMRASKLLLSYAQPERAFYILQLDLKEGKPLFLPRWEFKCKELQDRLKIEVVLTQQPSRTTFRYPPAATTTSRSILTGPFIHSLRPPNGYSPPPPPYQQFPQPPLSNLNDSLHPPPVQPNRHQTSTSAYNTGQLSKAWNRSWTAISSFIGVITYKLGLFIQINWPQAIILRVSTRPPPEIRRPPPPGKVEEPQARRVAKAVEDLAVTRRVTAVVKHASEAREARIERSTSSWGRVAASHEPVLVKMGLVAEGLGACSWKEVG